MMGRGICKWFSIVTHIKKEVIVLEINRKSTIKKEVTQEVIFNSRRIMSVIPYEQDRVEITFIDSGEEGEKYQTIQASFADYQKFLEHQICILIDSVTNNDASANQ